MLELFSLIWIKCNAGKQLFNQNNDNQIREPISLIAKPFMSSMYDPHCIWIPEFRLHSGMHSKL